MKYKRILLKLSGEAFSGSKPYGFDFERLNQYASEIKKIIEKGVEVAIVMGGGNIFRGFKGEKVGFDRVQGDYMGMLATVINALALQGALENHKIKSEILSGIDIEPFCQKVSRRRINELLEKKKIVLISGGTGNPYFTTDTAAVLRAIEMKADVLLKATRVDGVYSADPEKVQNAIKYEQITFSDAYEKQLQIMDLTAFTLCKENNLSVVVFNINKQDNLSRLIDGERIGTLVTN